MGTNRHYRKEVFGKLSMMRAQSMKDNEIKELLEVAGKQFEEATLLEYQGEEGYARYLYRESLENLDRIDSIQELDKGYNF